MPRRVLNYIESTVSEWRSAKQLIAGGAEGWLSSIPLDLNLAGLTHKGSGIRDQNQDGIAYYAEPNGRTALLVADGIGGQPGGATASELLLQAILAHLVKAQSILKVLSKIVPLVFEGYHRSALKNGSNPRLSGSMGTTYAAVDIRADFAHVYHQGDTKAVHVRNGVVVAETEDHTLAQELKKVGNHAISERSRHIVTSCMNLVHGRAQGGYKIAKSRWQLEEGDWIIVASDGLFDVLDPSEVATIVATFNESHKAVYALNKCTQMLVSKGAKDDNVGVIAYRHSSRLGSN